MTKQILSENRNLIIATITENFGTENINAIMTFMVNGVENTTTDSIEDYLNEVIEMMQEKYIKPVKESKLAKMVSAAHEGEQYNALTKNWEKI